MLTHVLLHFVRGFAMGSADIVPGVSGGTIALVLGIYERLLARPDRLYGAGIGSSYQRQGLKLSKHFKPL